MRRMLVVMGLMYSWVGGWGMGSAYAESRPLKQLPSDLLRWSTIWTEVPRAIYEVGRRDGPVAAVTWGPTQGTARLIESTTEEVWKAMKPDKRPRSRAHGKDVKGIVARYEF